MLNIKHSNDIRNGHPVRFVPNGRNTTSSKRSINATRYGQLGQALAYVYFEEEQGGPVAISASPATRPGTTQLFRG